MPDARSEIESVNKRFMELYEAGGLTGFAKLYTQDALVMLPGLKALEGRAGAMSFLESAKGRSIARVKLNTLELEIFGDTAWSAAVRRHSTPMEAWPTATNTSWSGNVRAKAGNFIAIS